MLQTFDENILTDELLLNYHLMHPGGDSRPSDPNAAFCIDGTYHLHYIFSHPWRGLNSYSFAHITSNDLLHWTWQPTKLQPAFTGHGMFSGTGFVTREGRPAAIYHGQGSEWNQITIARDNQLSTWDEPYPVQPKTSDGGIADMRHWDPDCFLIGDSYYAISGGSNPPLIKSNDLQNWTVVGDFLSHEPADVAIGEDVSCPNFFPVGDKWMLLCISHPFGCRYYLGNWDAAAEQFIPERHERMNWHRPEESIYDTRYRNFFAPESVLTTDRRRVMWAWSLVEDFVGRKTVQSLPRELSLGIDGALRMRPLRELESLRYDHVELKEIVASPENAMHSASATEQIADLDGDSYEIRIRVDRAQTERKRFGVQLFADQNNPGLEVMIRPETSTLRLGTTDAPFAIVDLPEGEDLELRIFVDKYVVEVFANDRQAAIAAYHDYQTASGLRIYSYGEPTTFREVTIWKLQSTNQGIIEARENRIWEPQTE